MNNKGGFFVITWIFTVIIFIMIWAFWLGETLSFWATRYIEQNSATGIEAFLISNINLWIFIWLIIISIFVFYGGGD